MKARIAGATFLTHGLALGLALVLLGCDKTPDKAVADPKTAPSAATTVASASAAASKPVASAPPVTNSDGIGLGNVGTAKPSASKSASPDTFGSGGLGLTGTGQGGGCPCGCDHSVDMVADLRGEPRDVALRGIDEALHTIGEREDAGYITERMIEHRLRLLDFGKELGRVGPARFSPVPKIVAAMTGKTSDGTQVGAELLVFGQTTEIVHDKEKLLLASFVLRLDLENTSGKTVTLRAPTVVAPATSGSFPVSRWYLVGSAGEPWGGTLEAGARRLVYVIGYASEPLSPGAPIDATVHFESLVLPAKTHARKHWNDPS